MSSNFWQDYHFRIEPWGTDYDSPIDIQESVPDNTVDPNVEGGDWVKRKLTYEPTLPKKIIFIDGRRRLDARFLGRQGNEVLYGAFATIAVGAVVINLTNSTASFWPPIIRRTIALGGNCTAPVTNIPCPLGTRAQLTYDLCLTAPDNEPQTPLSLVQTAMLEQEAKFAMQFAGEPEVLIIRDGPLLHQSYKVPESTLGYVKTMGLAYLPDDYAKLLWQLDIGERTPIFAIGQAGNPNRRWSWYLRSGQSNLNPKLLGYHDLQGLVRLDLHSEVPITRAIKIAELSSYLIPQYASHPSRDSRAPQNLTPVGGLEKELGRWMGNKAVIERRLRSFFAQLG